MIKLGTHLSIAKGFANAAETAVYIGANTFQFLVEIQEEEMLKNLMKKI